MKQVVLSKDADHRIPDGNGVTPLAKATMETHTLAVEALQKHETDCRAQAGNWAVGSGTP